MAPHRIVPRVILVVELHLRARNLEVLEVDVMDMLEAALQAEHVEPDLLQESSRDFGSSPRVLVPDPRLLRCRGPPLRHLR